MSWKKIDISGEAHDFEKEAVLEGVYVSKKENVGPNHSNLYYIKNEAGDNIAMWGSTVIDNQMSMVEVNSKVKVTYLGKVQSEKRKGSSYKNFMVEVWDDNLGM